MKASFVDTIKPNEDKVYAKRIDKTEYAKAAEAAYQQINDLIERFQKIDAALVDPLDVKKKLELLEEKRNILLTELDTQIKVSNATTFIPILIKLGCLISKWRNGSAHGR